MMKNIERIKYYMGDLYYKNELILTNNYDNIDLNIEKNNINKILKLTLIDLLKLNKINFSIIINRYIDELINFLLKDNYYDNPFIYIIGDCYKNDYCFSKVRDMNNTKSVLLKCPNEIRHWNKNTFEKVKNNDIPYNKKLNKVVWRGASTGSEDRPGNRFDLVKNYFNKNIDIDIGFNIMCQGNEIGYNKYKKDSMSIEKQLQYKFIISVEGNDVASGLKWQLYSNSLVMMPKPTIVSWLMEDMLIPYTHYIPLENDFSDLEKQFVWCINNPRKCKEIIQNAKNYMNQFMNEKNENEIQSEILKLYFEKVKFIK